MSKVISFSISDRYLDKLRTLYPSLTDNLAVKQFVTDRLNASSSSSLDDSLDAKLDDSIKTLIESWVDGLLDERLDDAVKKSVTSLSERMARLEERLDDSLDGRLDDIMEQLLRLQREASIATSPIPNQEPGEPATAIEFLPLPPSPDVIDGAGDAIEPSTLEVSPSPPSPALEAIESLAGDNSLMNDAGEDADRPAIDLTNKEKADILGIHDSNLSKWLRKGIIPNKYLNKCRFNDDKTKILLI